MAQSVGEQLNALNAELQSRGVVGDEFQHLLDWIEETKKLAATTDLAADSASNPLHALRQVS